MTLPEFLSQSMSNVYIAFTEQIPAQYMPYIVLAFYTLVIAVYAIFVWRFYKFLARRNIFNLNLSHYNRTEHPFWNKMLASGFFLLEYIIILPLLVFFWFSILAVFLLLLSKSQDVNQILIIAAAIIAATRMTAYYSQDLSKDLAKIFPFTILVVFLLEPEFFSIEKMIARFSQIPDLLGNILVFLIFIFALEVIMRFLFTVVDLFSSSSGEGDEQVGVI